jgi:hypothetical protein
MNEGRKVGRKEGRRGENVEPKDRKQHRSKHAVRNV